MIDKLSSRNYSTWSCDLKYLLLEKGLWEIIEEKQKVPEISTTVTAEDVEKFKSCANKVLSLVYLNIEPEFKRLIADCSEPVDAWDRLHKNFPPDSCTHHMTVFNNLMEERIRHGETMNLFATRLKKIYLEIKQIDKNFSENYLNYQFLRLLPSKYDTLFQQTLAKPDDSFKFDLIIDELVAEETRQKLRDKDGATYVNIANTYKTWKSQKSTVNRKPHFRKIQ